MYSSGPSFDAGRRLGLERPAMTKSLFRYPADRIPTAIIVATTLLSLGIYLWVDNPWLLLAYWALMLVPRGGFSAWNHNHQHVMTFRIPQANRALEFCFALHTGMTTHTWVLHHVFGHHLNYLDQSKDESRWARSDGTQMGTLEYVLTVSATAYGRAFEVGKRYPKHQRTFVIYTAATVAFVVAAVAWRPLPGLLVFVLPMISTLLWTSWSTYDHHAGLSTDNPWEASYNIESRGYNWIAGNLGFHTAHHLRPGMHWSKLPQLHASIRDKIPEHLRGPWSLTRGAPAGVEAASPPESPPMDAAVRETGS